LFWPTRKTATTGISIKRMCWASHEGQEQSDVGQQCNPRKAGGLTWLPNHLTHPRSPGQVSRLLLHDSLHFHSHSIQLLFYNIRVNQSPTIANQRNQSN